MISNKTIINITFCYGLALYIVAYYISALFLKCMGSFIYDTIWRLSIFKSYLSYCCNCIKKVNMYIFVMSKTFHTFKLFESPIHSFMPCSRCTFHQCFAQISWILWIAYPYVTSISPISFHSFPRYKLCLQSRSEDLQIRPFATCKRTEDPTNPTSLNTDPNFISQSWTIKFMRKPTTPKWNWLRNSEISSVNSEVANGSVIIY